MNEELSSSRLKFDLSKGCGTPLGELPCFLVIPRRQGAAFGELERALEPLHRLVYGRPGITGERRGALESFKGFPPEAYPQVESKLGNLTKDKLRQIIKMLGIRQHVSSPIEDVRKGVTLFFMSPRDDGVIKLSRSGDKNAGPRTPRRTVKPASSPASRKRDASPLTGDQQPGKIKKNESASSPEIPLAVHKDTVRVATFKKVLKMTPEERQSLGAKALRLEIESEFGLPEGALKPLKDDITETATLVVRSLLEAEERASVANQPPAQDTPLESGE